MTATLSFLDSDTCGMLFNLWLDPTDKQQPNLSWLTTWVVHYSAGIFFEVKDGNYSQHSKIIHSLNALPLLKCQGGNPTILWRFSNILCASTSYQKRHFAIDSMTHLKYINVFFCLFCFVYLIKTMFGVHFILQTILAKLSYHNHCLYWLLSKMASKCLHTRIQEHLVETQERYQYIYTFK